MAQTKPTKPTNLMPRHFADDGVKSNFSPAKISSGFSANFDDILQGDNLNYMIDSIGKELQYLSTIVDFIVDMPINKTIKVNANNNLEYVSLVEDASNKANVGLDNLNTSGNNKVLPSQTGNSGKFLTTNGTSPSWTSVDIANRSLSNLTSAGEARLTEGKRNIGEIITSTIPLVDVGLHPLDGAKLEYGIYKDFIDYIASIYNASANYFCTEAEWQQSYTDYGVCGKFVYDSTNNTVRLPNITGIIEGTTDVSALGDLVEAGLPNITGTIPGENQTNTIWWEQVTGAFYRTETSNKAGFSQGDQDDSNVGLDASLSSSIYGNSSTVQPQSIKVLYYIVIATTTKTNIQVDIDEIATDLNGKADVDLSNCTKPHIVEVSPKNILPRWYRIYSNGWCEQGGHFSINAQATETPYAIALSYNFVDSDYTANVNIVADGTTLNAYYDDMINIYDKSQSTLYVGISLLSNNPVVKGIDWRAEGYIS